MSAYPPDWPPREHVAWLAEEFQAEKSDASDEPRFGIEHAGIAGLFLVAVVSAAIGLWLA